MRRRMLAALAIVFLPLAPAFPGEGDGAGTGPPDPGPLLKVIPYPGEIAAEITPTGDPATEDPVTHTPYQGYGDPPRGGFGGREIEVTNLDDDGPGSFRAACVNAQDAMIVFRVAGTIFPRTGITFTGAHVTIAGETAPPPGITLDGRGIEDPQGCVFMAKRTSDVIVRHLRARNSQAENFEIMKGDHILFDHCSSTYCGDGALDVDQGGFITISWCLIAGAMEASRSHGFKCSWHHNLFTDNMRRHPKIMGSDANPFDYRNNYARNWREYAIRTELGSAGNIVCNYFAHLPGRPKTWGDVVQVGESAPDWFISGNFVEGGEVRIDEKTRRETPHEEPAVTTLSPEAARTVILEKAGAWPRDEVDLSYIECRSEGPRPEKLVMPLPSEAGGGPTGPVQDPAERLAELAARVEELKKAMTETTGLDKKKVRDEYLKALEELRAIQSR